MKIEVDTDPPERTDGWLDEKQRKVLFSAKIVYECEDSTMFMKQRDACFFADFSKDWK